MYGREGLLVARYTGGTETPTGPRRITVEIECDRDAEEPRFEMHHVPSAPNYLLTVQSVHGCVKEAPAPPAPAPPPAPPAPAPPAPPPVPPDNRKKGSPAEMYSRSFVR